VAQTLQIDLLTDSQLRTRLQVIRKFSSRVNGGERREANFSQFRDGLSQNR
jgi:hypothetical protein